MPTITFATPDVPCEVCGLLVIDSRGQLRTGHNTTGIPDECLITIWDPTQPPNATPVAEVLSSALTEVQIAAVLLRPVPWHQPWQAHRRHEDLTTLVQDGLTTDGAHHKQHYLEQVAKRLGLPVTGYEPGTAP